MPARSISRGYWYFLSKRIVFVMFNELYWSAKVSNKYWQINLKGTHVIFVLSIYELLDLTLDELSGTMSIKHLLISTNDFLAQSYKASLSLI